MRIGIDAHILGKGKGGVETALLGIIHALFELDKKNEYLLYVSSGHPFGEADLPSNFRLRRLPVSNPWIQRPLVIPVLYKQDRLDLIHLQRIMPPWGCERCVLHVHDVLYETHPQYFPPLKRRIFNAMARASVKRATHIVTVTESSRKDIQRVYNIPPQRVTVISNGVEPRFFHSGMEDDLLQAALRRLGVAQPYVLVLGMLERHKNTHVAIRAFDEFVKRHPNYLLVLVGRGRSETRSGYPAELRALIGSLPSADRVRALGYVSNEDRLSLLNGAAVLLFPGTAEGFGLPPLEAMACGVPVIAAETETAIEVYGDAALMTKPLDHLENAAAMDRLASDEQLRSEMITRGLARARRFRWDRVAGQLLEVYRNAAS